MVQASGCDASQASPLGNVSCTLNQEGAVGQTQDKSEKLYLLAGMGIPEHPPRGVTGSVQRDECLTDSYKQM